MQTTQGLVTGGKLHLQSQITLPPSCLGIRNMTGRPEQVSARSIEEDKLLESALAEHWELDNR